MTLLHSILVQYLLETAVLGGVAIALIAPRLMCRDRRRVLAVLVGLNILRFAGCAGALAAVSGAPSSVFLYNVAIGDGLTAVCAVIALALILRRSSKGMLATLAMNLVGLAGILASECWLECLRLAGELPGTAGLHGPTIGAAVFTAIHFLVFGALRGEVVAARSR